MPLNLMDRLGVPAFHPFCRLGVLAWWYVPTRFEPDYFHVLEHVWTRVVQPSTATLMLAYFQLIIPPQDFPPFCKHFRELLLCLDHPPSVNSWQSLIRNPLWNI